MNKHKRIKGFLTNEGRDRPMQQKLTQEVEIELFLEENGWDWQQEAEAPQGARREEDHPYGGVGSIPCLLPPPNSFNPQPICYLCHEENSSQQNNALEKALEQPRVTHLSNYLFTRRRLVEPHFNSSLHLASGPLWPVHWTQVFTYHLFQQPLLALRVILGGVKPPLAAARPAPEVP